MKIENVYFDVAKGACDFWQSRLQYLRRRRRSSGAGRFVWLSFDPRMLGLGLPSDVTRNDHLLELSRECIHS